MKSWLFYSNTLIFCPIKLDNVNKGNCKITKHAKLWAKNAFDEW
jgi:hypothetical protein